MGQSAVIVLSMGTNFEHIVITRFNTEVSYAQDSPRLTDAWLTDRLVPFEAVCVPSMRNQTTRNFVWVVLVDSGSPEWFKQHMEAHAPLFRVAYVTGTVRTEDLTGILREAGLVKRGWVISTRLDSDDGLAEGYLKTAQDCFDYQERLFLEFPAGYQAAAGALSLTVWRSNPFLTLIERVSQSGTIQTAICRPHNTVLGNENVRTIWGAPQWLQSIHGTNNESALKVGVPRLRNAPPANMPTVPEATLPRTARLTRAARTVSRRVAKLMR